MVAAQGESYSNASANIDFTIGEVIIDTGTDGTDEITQGFHQTNWNFLGVEDFAPSYEAIIFPNSTEDVLNIRTSAFENVAVPNLLNQQFITEKNKRKNNEHRGVMEEFVFVKVLMYKS